MSLEIKRKQLILAFSLGTAAAIAGGVGLYYAGKSNAPWTPPPSTRRTTIETATSKIDPQEVWRLKLESSMADVSQKMELFEKLLNDTLPKVSSHSLEMGEGVQEDLSSLRQELADLKAQMHGPSSSGTFSTPSSFEREAQNSAPWNGDHPEKASQPGGIQKLILNLKESPKALNRTTDNTIPAGAFAKATLLGGVDASTSIQASQDPRPILLRLTDPGTLPRRLKSDLKSCHVLASAYGDLSSERVFMRLEKLTCTESRTHEISETIVSGYVAGEDGKAGLRGVIADRTGPLLRNSFIGGFLGGMGRFLTQAQQSYTYPLGANMPFAQANPLTNEQMLKSGVGSGVSNALDKYADFYIKRAEQMQPVLQVAAGREVDIVFTKSAALGETLFKSTVSRHRDRQRIRTVAELGQSQHEVRNYDPTSGGSTNEPIQDIVLRHEGNDLPVSGDEHE